MKHERIENMKRGWFVGNFEPSLLKTNDVEVAVKVYKKGDYEEAHYHKAATEITVIISGRAKMFEKVWDAGDIVVAEPGDVTDFEAMENTVNVVVKIPGVNNDKYLVKGKVN